MGALAEMVAIREAIEERMRALNMTGEISVTSGGSSATTWVGQPSDDDVIVEVRISREARKGKAE
ncbi:UNVERIFIED_ORG: hypothetical protein GGI66_003645 [Rhizobium esperanzae]